MTEQPKDSTQVPPHAPIMVAFINDVLNHCGQLQTYTCPADKLGELKKHEMTTIFLNEPTEDNFNN